MINLFNLVPQFHQLHKSKIISQNEILGWNITLKNKNGESIGSGTKIELNEAIRIAVAEAIERMLFKKCYNNSYLVNKLKLDTYNTTCGFAVGFNKEKTRFRSIYEAIERWVWSKWIDENYYIPSVSIDQNFYLLNKLSSFLISHFDKCYYFKKEFITFGTKAHITILICEKGKGVYVGSRFGINEKDNLEHASIEVFRHWLIAKNKNENPYTFPFNRIKYFSLNKESAFKQIPQISNDKYWPDPVISFSTEIETGIESIFCYRALCNNYKSWSEGDKTRFVY
jgi:hypothetical protein